MSNKIKISQLMDAYTDNEFFIQGESEVNIDMVKNNVIQKAAETKKRTKPIVKVLIAAAAAAVLAVGATAATIAIKGGYKTPTGLDVSYEAGEYYSSWSMSYDSDREAPIRVEEGNRLMFVADGQNIDITDLVDGNTPYIYSYDNSEGDACYIVVGGAAGDYGYLDLVPVKVSEGVVKWNEIGCNTNVPEDQWIPYPENLTGGGDDEQANKEQWEEFIQAEDAAKRSRFKPWCLAAFDDLGIWGSISSTGEHTIDLDEMGGSFRYSFGAESINED